MANRKQFPAEIYLTIEEEGTENEYLQVHTTPDTAAKVGEAVRTGRYMLHETVEVNAQVTVAGHSMPEWSKRKTVKANA